LPELQIVNFNDNRGLSLESSVDDSISSNSNYTSAAQSPMEILKLEWTAIGRSINDLLKWLPRLSDALKSQCLLGNDFGGIEFLVQITRLPTITIRPIVTYGRWVNAAETCQPRGDSTMVPFIESTACKTIANPIKKLHWSERMILLDFYDATGGENWKKDTNWGQTALRRICIWYGITCKSQSGSLSSTEGIVEYITLPDKNLVCSPPQSLFVLQSLQTLIFLRNNIDQRENKDSVHSFGPDQSSLIAY
jgi:hypothetical protein